MSHLSPTRRKSTKVKARDFMNIGIVTNVNSRGLLRDAELITPLIESAGHKVELLQFDESCDKFFGLLIFLEVVPRVLIKRSETAPWLIPNPEFLTPESIKTVKRSFGLILCKTHDSHRICTNLFGGKAHYTGFVSLDKFDSHVERKLKCLHVSGHSQVKGTGAVIDAWRWKCNGQSLKAQLTVVSDFPVEDLPENVSIVSGISEEELKQLQNEYQIHIQPSQNEGFSHVIHEALSVNASILTVDAPSMNEIHAAYKIPSTGSTLFNSVKMHEVSAIDIHKAVQDMLRLGRNGFAAAGMPRREFLDGNEAFKKAFAAHLADLGTKSLSIRTQNKCIAFLGNFKDEHSTENQILWALEQRLGYEVEKLQENLVSLDDIEEACECSQILLWVRTPTWLKVPDDEMIHFLAGLKRKSIKSVACHLDKFWGIPEREALIGKIPFWMCEYCFTADGSRQEDFAKRGVNHFWMRPAISEVFCHPGTPRDEYRCDVGFVGAKEYHSEYPFRKQMVEFLEETYGNRFKHIQGVRGHLLNDVYASICVTVGDCFQAGTPMYWSDRLPETVGRHGFLLHPAVEGLDIPVIRYEPQNLDDMRRAIDAMLQYKDREEIIESGVRRVLNNDTWTIRMAEIIRRITDGKKEHSISAD
jgi:hypothetical protein